MVTVTFASLECTASDQCSAGASQTRLSAAGRGELA